ncbi:hypothetical protein [Hydrogenophaga sp.]|uniref:hypothetical protein n=1 Tax=Hydrogenophaga sp. TaxID=1904254 RepID=UPI003F6A994C
MRNAPSVVFPVGRCAFYAGLLCMLAGLGLLVLLLWWWPWLGAPADAPWLARVAGWLGGLLWLGWVGFAWRSWLHAPVGRLQWDALGAPVSGLVGAGVWRWHRDALTDGAPLQQVERALDLQNRMLLRVRNPDGAHRWLWVERSSDPARWNDLRRALVRVA